MASGFRRVLGPHVHACAVRGRSWPRTGCGGRFGHHQLARGARIHEAAVSCSAGNEFAQEEELGWSPDGRDGDGEGDEWEVQGGVFELQAYDGDEGPLSYGYEVVGTALALAVAAAFLKILWYLFIVCCSLIATAFQYSVVALVLIVVVLYLGF